MGPFVDLATALGQKVSSLFVKQGVATPTQRAVSTSGDSFDFSAGVKKLLEPVNSLFNQKKAGVQILEGANSVGNAIFDSLARNTSSAIDKLFGNANKMPAADAREETNDVRAQDPFGSQLTGLGDAFKLFTQIQTANPQSTATTSAPQAGSNTAVWVIGGFVALGAVLLLTSRREA